MGKKANLLRLEYLDPAELQANPKNWRTHPEKQTSALRDVIAEVGWAGALLFNERTKRLIDGHARKELFAGKSKVPVIIGSWDEEQEKLILASLDPLSAMAEANTANLQALLSEIESGKDSLSGMLTVFAEQYGIAPGQEETVLKQLNTQPPPIMSWVLIGIPTVRFGEIANQVEAMAKIDGVIMETTANDG